jgi:hypothetical protein
VCVCGVCVCVVCVCVCVCVWGGLLLFQQNRVHSLVRIVIMRNIFTCTKNCNYRIAAELCVLETWFVSDI